MAHRLRLMFLGGLALSIVVASYAGAATKVDLTAFFNPSAAPGDYKVFPDSDGGSRTLQVLNADVSKKRIRYFLEITADGSVVGHEEHFLVPGKKVLLGSLDAAGLGLEVAHPKTVRWSKMVPGRAYRYKLSAKVFSGGQRIGKAKLSGTVTFLDFEPLDTPYWSYPTTARFTNAQTLTINVGGSIFTVSAATTEWDFVGVGSVKTIEESSSYQDGVLLQQLGPTEYWFDSGVIGGVAIP